MGERDEGKYLFEEFVQRQKRDRVEGGRLKWTWERSVQRWGVRYLC